MVKIKTILWLNCIMFCISVRAEPAMAENMVLSNIWLNGIDRNIETLLLKDDDQIYVECEALKTLQLKLALFQRHAGREEYCLVSAEPVQAEFDAELQSVKIQLPAQYFSSSDYALQQFRVDPASPGAFLNYNFFYGRDRDDDEFSTLAELGIFKDYWMLKNATIYRDAAAGQKLVRLNSSLDVDFPEKMTRLTLGDTTTVFNPLINSFRFGGLSYGTNFTEHPDFIYWNLPTLRGSAVLPSTVDLYINGISIYQQQITPGDYNLPTGANIQQAGDAQVVVEDILGNRSVQSFPVYINSQLLKPKLTEYNVALGKIRYNYDYKDNDYRDFFTNLYFRRGITPATTLGFNLAYSEPVQNYGLLWTQAVSKYFLLDTTAVASHADDTGQGFSVGASLSRNLGKVSLGLSSQYRSQDFKALGYSDLVDQPKLDHLLYITVYDVPIFNSVNLNYVERQYHQRGEFSFPVNRVLNIGFSRMLTPNLAMTGSYFNEFGSRSDSGAYFSLNYYFKNNKTLYADYSTDNESRLRYIHNSPVQNGFDYAIGANRRDGEMSYNAYGLLKTSVGDLSLLHDHADDYNSSQINYRGALVWLGGKTGLTKAVDNAFALVSVGEYADIDIYRSLSPVGHTQKSGELFVHNIVPYVNYDISFDQDQLPLEDKVDYASKKVSGLNQRGYIIHFPIYHTRMLVLRLLDQNQQVFPRATEVYLDGNNSEYFPVDAEGKVYLYGLKPGQHQIHVTTRGGQTCQSLLEIVPEKLDEMAQQPIDLVCK